MKNLAIPEYKFFFVRFTLIFLLLLTVFLSIFYYNSQSELERRKSNIQVQQKALLVGKKKLYPSGNRLSSTRNGIIG